MQYYLWVVVWVLFYQPATGRISAGPEEVHTDFEACPANAAVWVCKIFLKISQELSFPQVFSPTLDPGWSLDPHSQTRIKKELETSWLFLLSCF